MTTGTTTPTTFPCTLAIIGGSGLYKLPGITHIESHEVDTPFGEPSSTIVAGELHGVRLLFLPRHGHDHRFLPHEVNFRANIFALKALGATWCLSVNAVGSLRQEMKPGDIVVPDQTIDRTSKRPSTFFGEGVVAHVSMANPFCSALREGLLLAATEVGERERFAVHNGGTMICMEGPQFSSRAESFLYRQWGASIIGMTGMPEAKLAREAELPYASLSLVTDYDCWHEEEEAVQADHVFQTLTRNAAHAQVVITNLVRALPGMTPSDEASRSLDAALVTPPDRIAEVRKRELLPLLKRRLAL